MLNDYNAKANEVKLTIENSTVHTHFELER